MLREWKVLFMTKTSKGQNRLNRLQRNDMASDQKLEDAQSYVI